MRENVQLQLALSSQQCANSNFLQDCPVRTEHGDLSGVLSIRLTYPPRPQFVASPCSQNEIEAEGVKGDSGTWESRWDRYARFKEEFLEEDGD